MELASAAHELPRPARSPRKERRAAIAGGAIAVIAVSGSRGLTHRAVDRHLGMPQGSTSGYFRSRKALLEAAMARMVELSLDRSEVVALHPTGRRDAAEGLAAIVERMGAPVARDLMVAHFVLGLEALNDEQLAETYSGL